MFVFLCITVYVEIMILARKRQWFYISSKVSLSSKANQIIDCHMHTYLNIYFLENAKLIERKFHMGYSLDKTIDMTFVLSHLTEMAAIITYIYGKTKYVKKIINLG